MFLLDAPEASYEVGFAYELGYEREDEYLAQKDAEDGRAPGAPVSYGFLSRVWRQSDSSSVASGSTRSSRVMLMGAGLPSLLALATGGSARAARR